MLKKILKSLLNSKHRSYSSSDYKKRYSHQKHTQYGHSHYKHRRKSGSFFSSLFSS